MTPHPPHGHVPLPSRRGPLLNPIVIAMFLALAAGGVVMIVMMNRPPPPAQTQPAAPDDARPALRPAAKVVGTPDVKADADEMIALHTEKEDTARTTYKGKIVQVTGRIHGKIEDAFGGYVLTLAGGVEKFRGVRCTLARENVGQFEDVEKGFVVTIVGRCDELATHIEIKDCAIVSATPE